MKLLSIRIRRPKSRILTDNLTSFRLVGQVIVVLCTHIPIEAYKYERLRYSWA